MYVVKARKPYFLNIGQYVLFTFGESIGWKKLKLKVLRGVGGNVSTGVRKEIKIYVLFYPCYDLLAERQWVLCVECEVNDNE
ncbi:hypothetical protein CEXT_296331 [Caerostris extrusa]|uniref:Uncharacterized protein n=1 Tax=Caerostris extrusa TaxID=172846 RepID=A0AAV4UB51_CAEEX|nr:hypothetical protein CEXT_296331 [Caerostris extrusa]